MSNSLIPIGVCWACCDEIFTTRDKAYPLYLSNGMCQPCNLRIRDMEPENKISKESDEDIYNTFRERESLFYLIASAVSKGIEDSSRV